VVFEQIFEFEEILNTFARGSAAPGWEGGGGGLHGGVNFSGRRHGSAAKNLGSGRIANVEEFGCGGAAPTAVDIILRLGDVGGYSGAHDLLLTDTSQRRFTSW
jgi:hypothetical protein